MNQARTLLKNCHFGVCEAYELQPGQAIDSYAAGIIQSIITRGIILGLVGVLIVVSPFFRPIKKMHVLFLPLFLIAAPMLVGVGIGGIVGLAISFSACFKNSCSFWEGSAIFLFPILGALLAFPLSRYFYKQRTTVRDKISKSGKKWWIISGLAVIFHAISSTLFRLY